MNDELNKQLSTLADRLGTTVQHLWGVLVRQAYIDGLCSLITVAVCVLLAVGTIWFFFLIRPRLKSPIESKDSFATAMAPIEYAAFIIVLVALISVAGNNLYWVISDFLNPEFYAWREVTRLR